MGICVDLDLNRDIDARADTHEDVDREVDTWTDRHLHQNKTWG